jgi:hypothetical protein
MDDIIIHFRLKTIDGYSTKDMQNDDPYPFSGQFLQLYAEWERLVFKTASEHIVNKIIGPGNEQCIHIEILISESPNKNEPYPHG